MQKNRLVFIAIISLAVVGASTFIFLDESVSISDGVEVENVEEGVNLLPIQYDFPLHGEYQNIGTPAVMYLGDIDLTISNLPKVGETAEVEVTLTNNDNHILYPPNYYYDSLQKYLSYGIIITDNFEFVNQTNFNSVGGEHGIIKNTEKLDVGESLTMSVTIRAISDGMGYIRSGSTHQQEIHMHVGENETLLKEDYLSLHPEMRPQRSPPQQEQIELCSGIPCLSIEDIPQVNDGLTTITPSTEEGYRAFLKDVMEMSDEEIEELVQKYYPDPDASTQSFFLPSAYATSHPIQLYGIVTMSDLSLSPTIQTSIHDVKVCAWEYDSTTRLFDTPICDNTNSGGGYVISGIAPSSGDNTIDVIMTYSTNGTHSFVAGFSGQSTLNTNAYRILDSMVDDITRNTQINRIIQTDIGIENTNNAFWITDAIADTHQFILYTYGYDTDKVDVAWQFDGAFGVFTYGDNRHGAAYCAIDNSPWNCFRTETIALNGDTPVFIDPMDPSNIINNGVDNSNQRWTIIHEYGHHIMNNVYGHTQFYNMFDCPRIHYLHQVSALGCAWSEGWADILPSLVDGDATYQWTQTNVLNFETGEVSYNNSLFTPFVTVDSNGNDVGHLVESRVAAAIWDLYDPTNSTETGNGGVDDMPKSIQKILWTFMQAPNNFEGFYNEWQGKSGYPDSTNVMRLNHMGFVPALPVVPINTAPVATSHSTVSVDHNTATSITLRGIDADGDSLDFYIASNPSKGTLSHSSTRTAIPGDNGSSVTIVYTPSDGSTGSDYFTFKVNDGTVYSSSKTVRLSIADAPVVIPPTGGVIFSDDFEGTLSQWTLTGDDEDWELRSGIPTGTTGNVASSDDCDKNCYMVSDTIDASQATTLTFDRYISTSIDTNEGLKVEVSTNNGRTWSELVFYTTVPRSDDSTWHSETLNISQYQSSTFKIKFTGVSSSSSEIVQLDNVSITGSSGGTVLPPPTTTSSLFDENFNDLSNWSKSGTDRWDIVSTWREGMPEDGSSDNKILVASGCVSECILTSNTIDLSSYTSATLELSRFVDRSIDDGEYLAIEVYNGSTWTELAKWGDTEGTDSDDWESESFNISQYLDDGFKIKLITKENKSSEDVGLDYIRIVT